MNDRENDRKRPRTTANGLNNDLKRLKTTVNDRISTKMTAITTTFVNSQTRAMLSSTSLNKVKK